MGINSFLSHKKGMFNSGIMLLYIPFYVNINRSNDVSLFKRTEIY